MRCHNGANEIRKSGQTHQPWAHGDGILKQAISRWNDQPVWGTNRKTWIEFRAVSVPSNSATQQ